MKRPKNIVIKVIEHYEESTAGMWMIPYGNLMTVLMILFLILYTYTFMISKKDYEERMSDLQQEVGGENMTKELEEILQNEKLEDMEAALENKGLKKFIDVIISEEDMKITLRNPVLFGLGNAELGSGAKNALKEVVGLIGSTDNEIVVEGYTCNMPVRSGGRYVSNWELSAARAFSVVRYFIGQGVGPERLSAIGYGAYRPLFPNDNSEQRALNRRIEINIVTRK